MTKLAASVIAAVITATSIAQSSALVGSEYEGKGSAIGLDFKTNQGSIIGPNFKKIRAASWTRPSARAEPRTIA